MQVCDVNSSCFPKTRLASCPATIRAGTVWSTPLPALAPNVGFGRKPWCAHLSNMDIIPGDSALALRYSPLTLFLAARYGRGEWKFADQSVERIKFENLNSNVPRLLRTIHRKRHGQFSAGLYIYFLLEETISNQNWPQWGLWFIHSLLMERHVAVKVLEVVFQPPLFIFFVA